MGINRKFFFDFVRRVLFKGRLWQRQVDGLNFILDVWEADHARRDDRWLAYALGTTHLETDARIQPINEYGGRRYYFRMYDIEGDRPWKARELGNIYPGDGALFHGRGYVQLTGRDNYTKMQRRFATDLTSDEAAAERARWSRRLPPRSCSTEWRRVSSQARNSPITSMKTKNDGSRRARLSIPR